VERKKTSPTVMFGKDGGLAKRAFNVRARPRVIGLGEDGFGWAVIDQLTQIEEDDVVEGSWI
jgi:hypothetical protein